jgi:hypothetical protein
MPHLFCKEFFFGKINEQVGGTLAKAAKTKEGLWTLDH